MCDKYTMKFEAVVFIGFFLVPVNAISILNIAGGYVIHVLIDISNISKCFLIRKIGTAVVEKVATAILQPDSSRS